VHDKFDIRKLDLLKINAIEILMSITQQTQFGTANASLRTFVLCEDQKAKGYPFIKRLTSHMLFAFEQGIKVQVFEFFKQLLDNEQTEKKVEFNDLFYKESLSQFLSFLTSAEDLSPEVSSSLELPVRDAAVDSQAAKIEAYNRSLDYSRFLVVQLLTKCAQEHAFRFRIFAVQQEVIEKVSRLQRFNSRLLNLWIVKFYKAIIKAKDEAFVNYLTKKNLLKTISDIFIENPNKGNLLGSSILELFDYLSKEKVNKIG